MPPRTKAKSSRYTLADLPLSEPERRALAREALAEAKRKNALLNPKFAVFKRRYYYDWAGFVINCIKWDKTKNEFPADYQLEILAAFNSGCLFDFKQELKIDELLALPMSAFGHQVTERYAVRGTHGLGKTFIEALIILAFALTTDGITDWKCITTASRYFQLNQYLWPEVSKWANRIDWDKVGRPPLIQRKEIFDMKLLLSSGRAIAASPQRAEEMEGGHASRMMYVYDEAKIIKKPFFDAAEGAFATAGEDTGDEGYQMAASTPGKPSGPFYNIHSRKPAYADWEVRHVTVYEAIAAKRVSKIWVEKMKIRWKNHPAMLQNRVFGEFAVSNERSVIPLAWIEASIERWHIWQDEVKQQKNVKGILTSVGGDVSEGLEGSDTNTIAPVYDWVKVDTIRLLENGEYNDAVIQMSTLIGSIILGGSNRKAQAIIDAVGVGVGTLHSLRANGFWGRAYKNGFGTDMRDETGELGFANWWSASWWLLREALDPNSGLNICLPPDPEDRLIRELMTPLWRRTDKMLIVVDSKEVIKKELGISTDFADAVMMAIIGPALCDEYDNREDRYEYNRVE